MEPAERFLAAEHAVEAHSARLKKVLALRDLVLTQILFIVGLGWIGSAGKLGSSHVVFWLLAVVLFYIPSAVVVIHLNREMPLEGGLYQWAKLRFNEWTGFLVAWNLWMYVIVLNSELGLQAANGLAYAVGPRGGWIAASPWAIALASLFITGGLMLVATLGLGVGKWIHNAGGLVLVALFVGMAAFAIPHWARGGAPQYPLGLALPAVSLFSLNILGKMGFGALGGFEYMAIFAGECRDPARTIGRSVWIAAPLIAIIFILGTAWVLVFARPEEIDLISPITQVLSRGGRAMGALGAVVPMGAMLVVGTRLAQASLNFSGTIRLPMVAGWDHLLPDWFSRLHPRYRTPVGSILFIGASNFGFAVLTSLGVGNQEAYQLLQSGAGIFYALTYLVMFAIPVIAPGERPHWSVRIASVSGFLMTLLFIVLSIFPIIPVNSSALFTTKISGVVVGSNLVATAFYWRARARFPAGLR